MSLGAGPHDIAGALWHQPTETWHLMAGCWSNGGWQHMTSKDLVTWATQGAPRGFGGTGGLTHDDDGTIVAYAMTGGGLHFWRATDEHATNWTETGTVVKSCCNDPIVWKAAGRWYAITADHGTGGPHPATNCKCSRSLCVFWPKLRESGCTVGDETFFSSQKLSGPGADWQPIKPAFFENKSSLLVPGHPMSHEFVSPDFVRPPTHRNQPTAIRCPLTLDGRACCRQFQNITGDASGDSSVFLTSTYGPLNDAWQNQSGLFNYALFFLGSQPAGAGTTFVPRLTTAVDWSPFSPNAETPGGLDVATGWGPTQFGCCESPPFRPLHLSAPPSSQAVLRRPVAADPQAPRRWRTRRSPRAARGA